MAEGLRFKCDNCGREIDTWDEGNPYYLGPGGKKQYAYHPDPRQHLCAGNDSSTLPFGCGVDDMNDSEPPLQGVLNASLASW